MFPESFTLAVPTPFHFCIMWNRMDCLEALIAHAAVPITSPELLIPDTIDAEESLQCSSYGRSLGYTHLGLVATAVYFENVRMARFLCQMGVNINPRRTKEFPPLLLAIGTRELVKQLVKLLLEFGANATIYHPKVKGNVTLLSSIHNHQLMIMLISHGAEVDSLFHPRTVKPLLYKFAKYEGLQTHNDEAWNLLQSLELLGSDKYSYNVLKFLMPFVQPLPKDELAKYRKLLSRSGDLPFLQSWSRWVPSLMQLSRSKIRTILGEFHV
jgi:ankyrin repeat protein